MGKKGVADPVFVYIFALVAGMIILFFFLSFSMKHKGTANLMESGELASGMDNSLAAFSALGQGEKEFEFPFETELFIDPGSVGAKSGAKQFSKPTRSIIYSPKSLKGKKVAAWTIRWKAPFSITNFFYLTTDKDRYFIVYGNDHSNFASNFMKEEIPDKIKPSNKLFGMNEFSALKAAIRASPPTANLKVIIFGDDVKAAVNNQLSEFNGKYSVVEIIPLEEPEDNFEYDFGYVQFEGEAKRAYIGRPMMYGGMIAENAEYYDYSYTQAMDRLRNVTQIYTEKIRYIKAVGNCPQTGYNSIEGLLSQLQSDSEESPESVVVSKFMNNIKAVEDMNKDIMGAGCQALF